MSPQQAMQELEQQGAAADGDASKPTLRQRLDRGGQALPEEEIMQNPLQLHKVGWPGGWSCVLLFVLI